MASEWLEPQGKGVGFVHELHLARIVVVWDPTYGFQQAILSWLNSACV